MLAWTLTAENAQLFFELCIELKADNEIKRVQILREMARLGKIKGLTKTPMTRQQYLEHLGKNFKVAEIKNNGSIAPYSDDRPKED